MKRLGTELRLRGMLTRKKKYPLRLDSGGNVDENRPGTPSMRRKDSEIIGTKMSAGRMSTRSDIVVEKSPNQRRDALNNAVGNTDRDVVKHTSRTGSGRESGIPSLLERRKPLALDLSAAKSATETAENTPTLSMNGSVSGTSVTQRIHRKNAKNKGTCADLENHN